MTTFISTKQTLIHISIWKISDKTNKQWWVILQTPKYQYNYRMITDKILNVNNYKMATTSKKESSVLILPHQMYQFFTCYFSYLTCTSYSILYTQHVHFLSQFQYLRIKGKFTFDFTLIWTFFYTPLTKSATKCFWKMADGVSPSTTNSIITSCDI